MIVRVVKKFRSILSAHQKIRIAQLIILMVIGGILETVSVSMILPFMNMIMSPDKIINNFYIHKICIYLNIYDTKVFLVFMALSLALLYFFKNIYLVFEYNVQYRFVYGNMFAMQHQLLHNFIHKPYEYFLSVNSGEIIRIVNVDTPNTFAMLLSLLNLFTEIVVSAMLLITVFFTAPDITLIMAAVLAVLLLFMNMILKPRLKRAGVNYQKASAGVNKWLLQSIQGIKEIKVMTKEGFFQENFDRQGSECIKSLRKNQIYSIMPRFFIEAVCMGTMLIVIAGLIYNGLDLQSLIPMLTAVAMAAVRLLPAVNRISSFLASISYNEPMMDKLIENLKKITEKESADLGDALADSAAESRDGDVPVLERELKASSVSFRYPKTKKCILNGASMIIRYGESVGIVGESGAGKTTVVDIILGLLQPQEGGIYIDGINIQCNIQAWMKQIGYIPQSIFMLDDTILANVAFGIAQEDISVENVWRVLKEASLDKFVKTLPDTIYTQIGERGVRLSGGQRQRIGIARALYLNPEILVFDEATSALDNKTESEIMESINNLRGKKTMIIIAHRLTTLQSCDRIYRVENGYIKAEHDSGEHQE